MGDKESDLKKQQPHEMHNSELVSKLMGELKCCKMRQARVTFLHSFSLAATPSYFFTPPQAGHNFFFSELLRSLVQKRKADELTTAMKVKAVPKKARKQSYHYQKPMEPEWKRQKLNEGLVKISDSNENDDPKTNSPMQENSQDSVINVDKDDSPPAPNVIPSTLVSQPNPSAFYPYVDPLHFFIDLRVSAGQVQERKKEAYLHQALKNNNILLDSNTWNNPIISKNRVGSAFKVPGSMSETNNNNNFSAINLIANNSQISTESSPKFYSKHHPAGDSPNEKNDEDIEIFDLEVKSDAKRND